MGKIKTVKQARAITSGDISNSNSKMLGTSFGLSTEYCKTGAVLSKIAGSVCAKCYAKRGTGVYKSVRQGRENNTLAVIKAENTGLNEWVSAMVFLINKRCSVGYHRWHDSGDLQSIEHFKAIIKIAELLPHIKFWLPTKEKRIISAYTGTIPDNLCVRLSASMIDTKPPIVDNRYQTSTVHSKGRSYDGNECRAYQNGNQCGSCSMCYDKTVSNVSYKKH